MLCMSKKTKTTQVNFILEDVGLSTHLMTNNNSKEHKHTHYEVIYVLSGEMINYVNDEPQVLTCGDLIILEPSYYHRLKTTSHSINRDIMVSVELFDAVLNLIPQSVEKLKGKGLLTPINFSVPEIMEIENLIKDFSSDPSVSNKRCVGIIILLKIIKKIFTLNDSVTSNLPPLVKKICDNMTKDRFIKGGVPTILNDLSYSSSHVFHTFKKTMGLTLTEYVKDIRLTHIAYYLKTTDYSLRQICDLVGIESLAYANKIFKAKYNVTPIKYRKGKY